MRMRAAILFATALLYVSNACAQAPQEGFPPPEKVIIDMDIGGDIDDAYAIALALQSPELKILAITTESKDAHLQARLVRRMLIAAKRSDIVVATGVTHIQPASEFLEAQYAKGGPSDERYPDGIKFILDTIRGNPGEITLIGIGPLTDFAAALDRDPVTFRRVKRIVIMGGSVYRGLNIGQVYLLHDSSEVNSMPSAEANIMFDIPAAKKIFGSDIPLHIMPLDSTQIKLDETRRAEIFRSGTPLTDSLTLQHLEWAGGNSAAYPATLFDAVAVAYAINQEICPTTIMDLRVDDRGMTVVGHGPWHVYVCLHSDTDQFFNFFMPSILKPISPKSIQR